MQKYFEEILKQGLNIWYCYLTTEGLIVFGAGKQKTHPEKLKGTYK
jgi:hypothetical protein